MGEIINAGIEQEELLPPMELVSFTGVKDYASFKRTGAEFFKYIVDLCGLKPDGKILDIGCGCGKMALTLLDYLTDAEAAYYGFDIAQEGIEWCSENITPRYANFKFDRFNIYNSKYNKDGQILAKDFKFPFADGSFDVVILISVFTHLLPEDLNNFFTEINRVLKKGGKSLITYYMSPDDQAGATPFANFCDHGKNVPLSFQYEMGEGCKVIDKDMPELACSYSESYVRNLYAKHNVDISDGMCYGRWSGRENTMSHQDVVIGTKK